MPLGIPPTSDLALQQSIIDDYTRLNASRHSSDVGPDTQPSGCDGRDPSLNASRHSSDVGPRQDPITVQPRFVSMPLGIPPTSDQSRHSICNNCTEYVSMPLGIPPTSDRLCGVMLLVGVICLNASRHSSDVGPVTVSFGSPSNRASQCLSAFLRRRTAACESYLADANGRLNASRHSSDVGPWTCRATHATSFVSMPLGIPPTSDLRPEDLLYVYYRLNASRHSSDVGPAVQWPSAWGYGRLNASRHSSDVGPGNEPGGCSKDGCVSMPLGIPPTSDRF